MKKSGSLRNKLIIGALLISVGFIIADHLRSDKLKDQQNTQQRYDVQQQLEQASERLRREKKYRDSIFRSVDSLISHVATLDSTLKMKDKEIEHIRGRYNHIKADSLGSLMESRANANR